jgi:hypothetical protein
MNKLELTVETSYTVRRLIESSLQVELRYLNFFLCLFFLNLFFRLWVDILWRFRFFPLGIDLLSIFYVLLNFRSLLF